MHFPRISRKCLPNPVLNMNVWKYPRPHGQVAETRLIFRIVISFVKFTAVSVCLEKI